MKSRKLKWKYEDKRYYSEMYGLDFMIKKSFQFFQLNKKQYLTWEPVACVKKLSSAKKIADLIING